MVPKVTPQKYSLEHAAMTLTHWVGSLTSVVIHTILFIGSLVVGILFQMWNEMLLILTTIVSLEAIYLAIFIQMTVNRNTESLEEVEEDLGEIQEDVGELQQDVDEIQEDIDEIQEDVGEISEAPASHISLDQIQKNLEQMLRDIDQLRSEQKQTPHS